jgi:hypothetical protein
MKSGRELNEKDIPLSLLKIFLLLQTLSHTFCEMVDPSPCPIRVLDALACANFHERVRASGSGILIHVTKRPV